MGYAPPITSDPPFHMDARRLLLPAFAPKASPELEEATREFCRELLDDLLADGTDDLVDAAVRYAQHIPVRVIAQMLGVPGEDGDRFRMFIHRIIEKPGEVRRHARVRGDAGLLPAPTVAAGREEPPPNDLVGYLSWGRGRR